MILWKCKLLCVGFWHPILRYTFYEFLLTMTLEESKDSRSGWLSVIYHKTQTKNVEVEALFGCHVSTLSLGRHARAFQSTAEAG